MKYFPLLAAMMLASTAAFGQTASAPAPASSSQPIEITATETVEWLRNQNQYIARKDVIVKQGPMEIHSDLLTADYREGAESSMEIWQLTAEGNVQVKDETTTAYGDKGVYDVPKGVAILTGGNLRLVSPDQTVTATERMEYYANERMAKAIGNATVVRAEDKLQADVLTAYFKDESTQPAAAKAKEKSAGGPLGGGGNIDRLEADGNVVITTPTEKITGRKAVYRAATNTAEITGKVKLVRGENILEGERAEVNLKTNVSKMFGSKTESGRVRGVFFPGSESLPDKKGRDKKATAPSAPAADSPTRVAPAPEAADVPPAAAPAVSATPEAPAPAKVSPRMEY
ncbi:MAG TPA: LptA/OstA family protein [Micavibrio sp.]|nr:LptA/OstA family protein [Micavibrio sp.]